jgi:hypothetical protein
VDRQGGTSAADLEVEMKAGPEEESAIELEAEVEAVRVSAGAHVVEVVAGEKEEARVAERMDGLKEQMREKVPRSGLSE